MSVDYTKITSTAVSKHSDLIGKKDAYLADLTVELIDENTSGIDEAKAKAESTFTDIENLNSGDSLSTNATSMKQVDDELAALGG